MKKIVKYLGDKFFTGVINGLIAVIVLGLLMQFYIIPKLISSPKLNIDCINLKKHNLIVSLVNQGKKEAESFSIIFTNNPMEGSILNFSDELDEKLCKIESIRANTYITLNKENEIERKATPRRTIMKCDFLPVNHRINLRFQNWASDFLYEFWAKNLDKQNGNLTCNWSYEALNTYCGESKC